MSTPANPLDPPVDPAYRAAQHMRSNFEIAELKLSKIAPSLDGCTVYREPVEKTIDCPFTIVADVNEYLPQHNGYRFDCPLYANADQKNARIIVKTMTANLPAGDYTIFGMPGIIIERKSKADLYQSISKRKNFIERLEMMQEIGRREVGGYAAVVVECNDVELLKPPPFTKMLPKSVSRTIISWRIKYAVDWWFLSTRARAEVATFRMLERYYLDHCQSGK